MGERLLGCVGIRPYRCTSCFWRGYGRPGRDGSLSVMAFSEERLSRALALVLQGLILVGIVGVCILVLLRKA